jgi:hypothetical protein
MRASMPASLFWKDVRLTDESSGRRIATAPFDYENRCGYAKKPLLFGKIDGRPTLKINPEVDQRDFDLCSPLHSTLGEPS